MRTLIETPTLHTTTTAPARADLRAQIARLERRLAEAVINGAPIAFRGRAAARPHLLSLSELERERDSLTAQLAQASVALAEEADAQEHARMRLEAMLADPPAHRYERVALRELGEGGCGVYAVRPRLGLIGMLAGWWHVKLSSGCPLAMRHRALHAIAAAVAIAALALPAAAAADWPVYGHDLANTRDAGTEGPAASQVGALKRAWSFTSPTGDFTGTPVVADGVVVAGDHGGHVYALDAVRGRVLWSKDVGHPVNGSAAIDPAAPGGATAYVPVAEPGRPHLVALGLRDGAARWDRLLTDQANASVYGSPAVWRGTVYIGTSGPNNDDTHARGSVVAIDQASGAIRWQTYTVPPGADGAAVWSTPAIDPATGQLYVGTGNNYHEPATGTEDAILALDASTGAISGAYQATSGDTFAADNPAGPDYDFGASPNLFTAPDGRALVGEGQKSGVYWALDRATMKPVWKASAGPGGPVGGILGSTAFDGTHVYGADSLDGSVVALTRAGNAAWTSRDGGGAHFAATSVAHGVVYTVDPSGTLVARDPKSGTTLARLSLGGPSFGGVSATGHALYVAVGTGPPPEPAPQADGSGAIVAFGDTSASGPHTGAPAGRNGAPPATSRRPRRHLTLRLAVRPRRVHAHRPVSLRFRVLLDGRPHAGTAIRVGGRRVRTDRAGRARMTYRFGAPGRRFARAGRRTRAAIRIAG